MYIQDDKDVLRDRLGVLYERLRTETGDIEHLKIEINLLETILRLGL